MQIKVFVLANGTHLQSGDDLAKEFIVSLYLKDHLSSLPSSPFLAAFLLVPNAVKNPVLIPH